MTEAHYIILQRLTLLRIAESLLREAVVHLHGTEDTDMRAALRTVTGQIEADQAKRLIDTL